MFHCSSCNVMLPQTSFKNTQNLSCKYVQFEASKVGVTVQLSPLRPAAIQLVKLVTQSQTFGFESAVMRVTIEKRVRRVNVNGENTDQHRPPTQILSCIDLLQTHLDELIQVFFSKSERSYFKCIFFFICRHLKMKIIKEFEFLSGWLHYIECENSSGI